MEVLDELNREMRVAEVRRHYGVKELTIHSIKKTDDMMKGSDSFLCKSCLPFPH
jgi:hypothetical protein